MYIFIHLYLVIQSLTLQQCTQGFFARYKNYRQIWAPMCDFELLAAVYFNGLLQKPRNAKRIVATRLEISQRETTIDKEEDEVVSS